MSTIASGGVGTGTNPKTKMEELEEFIGSLEHPRTPMSILVALHEKRPGLFEIAVKGNLGKPSDHDVVNVLVLVGQLKPLLEGNGFEVLYHESRQAGQLSIRKGGRLDKNPILFRGVSDSQVRKMCAAIVEGARSGSIQTAPASDFEE